MWRGMYACPHTNTGQKINHDTIDQLLRTRREKRRRPAAAFFYLPAPVVRMEWKGSHVHKHRQHQQPPSVINFSISKEIPMAFNEDSSASGHDEPWIQW